MRRIVATSVVVLLSVAASGVVAGTGVTVSSAGAALEASKAAFCRGNDAIDRASVHVNSAAGFMAVLKAHSQDLAVMEKNLPPGALGQQVQQFLTAVQAAISSNDANALANIPNGVPLDTYCGVDGTGRPLPPYFNKGTTTAFCANFLPAYIAVSNANDPTSVLAALTAHKTQIDQARSELSSLPRSIRAKATTTVRRAETAIAANNAAILRRSGGGGPAADVALYCGQNQ